jgi:hypothetical protein
MTKRLLPILAVLGILWFVSGCAINKATASLTPGSSLSDVKSFYVVKLPEDKNGVDELIRKKLVAMGYSTTVGPERSPPYRADAVVTYADKWMWDMTMYMIELTITLRNPASNFPMATGYSMHTSLSRKSPEEMVEEVLTNIFKASKEGKSVQ